jgi:hypothetical protein
MGIRVLKSWILFGLIAITFSSQCFAGPGFSREKKGGKKHKQEEKNQKTIAHFSGKPTMVSSARGAEERLEIILSLMTEDWALFSNCETTKDLDCDIKNKIANNLFDSVNIESIVKQVTDTGKIFTLVRSQKFSDNDPLNERGPAWEDPDGTKWYGVYSALSHEEAEKKCRIMGLELPEGKDYVQLGKYFKKVPAFFSDLKSAKANDFLWSKTLDPNTDEYFQSYSIADDGRGIANFSSTDFQRYTCIEKPLSLK